MNHGSFDKNRIDWVELDRLVDGHLDEFEYRELLHRIADHPEGWRRCAMAFLEHQALERELGELAEGSEPLFADPVEDNADSETSREVTTEDALAPSKRGFRAHISALITMSACILVGLAIGNTATDGFRDVLRAPSASSSTAIDEDSISQVSNTEDYDTENACKNCPRGLNENFRNNLTRRNTNSPIVPTN